MLQGRQVLGGVSTCVEVQVVVIWLQTEMGFLLMSCLCKFQQWLSLPCSDADLGLSHVSLICLKAKLPSRDGVFIWPRLMCTPGWSWETNQPLLLFSIYPASGASKQVNVPHKWSPGFPQPLVSPTGPPTSKETCLPCVRAQDWGAQYVSQTAHPLGSISAHVTTLLT